MIENELAQSLVIALTLLGTWAGVARIRKAVRA
jgi:hypothetical protein